MRVLSFLSLLCVSVLGVSGQYVTDGTNTNTNGYVFSAPASITGTNPTLSLTAGNTYTFNVGNTPAHPFAFSATGPTNTAATTPIDTTQYTVTQTGCTGTGASGNGFTGASCIVSLAINVTAPTATIYYKCTIHPAMTGTINIVGNSSSPTTAAPTTAAPTTGAPTGTTTAAPTTGAPTGTTTAAPTTGAPTGTTTAAPTTGAPTTAGPTTPAPTTGAPTTGAPTVPTGATITSNTFHITSSVSTQAWVFTSNGVQYANPTLQVTAGQPVTFSFEFANDVYHPFGFSPISSPATVAATQTFFPDAANGFTVSTASTCDTTYGSTVNSTIRTVKVNPTTWTATTPCVISVSTAASDAGNTLYYRCARHPAMVGTINIVSGASTVAGAGFALVIAVIAAIMA